jgi:hypothetical protein
MDETVATVPAVKANTPTPAPAVDVAKAALEETAGMGEAPMVGCDVNATVQQCCSASGCSGKVLNNRDAHNCKNSGGKSWHAAARGGAPAACQRM